MNGDQELLIRLLRDSAAVFLVDPDEVISKERGHYLATARSCVYWYLVYVAEWPLHRITKSLPYKYTHSNVSITAKTFWDRCQYSDRTEGMREKAVLVFDSTWNEISDSRLLEEKKSRKGHRFTRS
jgi:hypothetical protein